MNICGIVIAHNEDLSLPYAIERMGLPYIAILDKPTPGVRKATEHALRVMQTPDTHGDHVYRWSLILDMMAQAAREAQRLGFQWVLRIDADEDWHGAEDEIRKAYAAGANVVDFAIQQFRPTKERVWEYRPDADQEPTAPGDPIHLEPRGNFYQRAWALDGNWSILSGGHTISRKDAKIHKSDLAFRHFPAPDLHTLWAKARRKPDPVDAKKNPGWHIQYKDLAVPGKSKTTPFHIFFHVAMMGIWEEVLQEQVARLQASGILDECATATAICVGGPDLPTLPAPFRVIHGGDLGRYEFPTLEALQAKAGAEQEAVYLYLHTKGVSKPKSRRWLDSEWRRYMMWGCVDHWRECVDALKHSDLAGVEWYAGLSPSASGNQRTGSHGFFAGNFWWARGDFLAHLPSINTIDHSNRWSAEAWIGTGKITPEVHEVANIKCSERPGMFPREFCGKDYQTQDRIVLVDVKKPPRKNKTLRRWLDASITGDATVYVMGVDPAWFNFPHYLTCRTPPNHYTERIEYIAP